TRCYRDWSSDVYSSDLYLVFLVYKHLKRPRRQRRLSRPSRHHLAVSSACFKSSMRSSTCSMPTESRRRPSSTWSGEPASEACVKIGRASCRGRGEVAEG